MKIIILTVKFLTLIYVANAQSPTVQWAKNIGGNGSERPHSVTTDALGNVYTTGWFEGTADFDPSASVFNLTSAGGLDIFVVKVNAAGDFVWAKNMGGTLQDAATTVIVDALGNVYITGSFSGSADFDPSAGTSLLNAAGSEDIFVLKLGQSGDFKWARRAGETSLDQGNSIAVDPSGNVYAVGFFNGMVDFDPGPGLSYLTSVDDDIFVWKLDSSGNLSWAKNMGGSSYEEATMVVLDASGNIYTTGYFVGTADFDPSASTFNLTSSALYYDAFISKLDNSGKFVWAKNVSGDSISTSLSLAIDGTGNIYATGWFQGTVDFDPGASSKSITSIGKNDGFILKLNSSGIFIWAKTFGGSAFERGQSIALDASANVYITGFFSGTPDFDPGIASFKLTENGGGDIFILKLNSSGDFGWAAAIGNVSSDNGEALTVDKNGNLYITGEFTGTVDFDFSSGTSNLVSAGGWNVFLMKIINPSSGIITNYTNFNFNIYPNPLSTDMLNVSIQDHEEGLTIEIYNSIGMLVSRQKAISEENSVDFTGNSGGLYFMYLIQNGKIMASQKIVRL